MDRRDFLKATGTGALGLALGILPKLTKAAAKKPNIILCMADDQGWGDMAYNGHPVLKTPHFDTMASEAMQFDHFYAAAPVCSPTRGSVMTGRHPNRFGCFQWGHTLRPQEITIAEALKTAGYVTGHFGKWHIGPARLGTPTNPGASGFDEWFSAPNFYDNDPILSRNGTAVKTEGESSMVTADAAIEFIEKQVDNDQPFLAVVWFGNPHRPHEPHGKYKEMYSDQDEKKQNLYAEITAMDAAVGKMRQSLRDLGIHENTIFWYTSDNGGLPEAEASGGRGYKGDIYEGGLRVPAILEWPDQITEHSVVNVPANTSDIYPTILDILGVQLDNQPQLDGISLQPLVAGDMNERPEPMGFWDYPIRGVSTPAKDFMAELYAAQQNARTLGNLDRVRVDSWKIEKQYPTDTFPGHAAWLDWPWKLHRIEDDENPGDVTLELYHLEKDPMEETDLSSRRKKRVEALLTELEAWQASVINSLNGNDYIT
jgi:arylsulfatase A-like enzyme